MNNVTPIQKPTTDREQNKVENLSFVLLDKKKGRDFWDVKRTGDYHFACMIGKALGKEALWYFSNPEFPLTLNYIVSSMVKKGVYGGVEVGFMIEIAKAFDRAQQRAGSLSFVTGGKP